MKLLKVIKKMGLMNVLYKIYTKTFRKDITNFYIKVGNHNYKEAILGFDEMKLNKENIFFIRDYAVTCLYGGEGEASLKYLKKAFEKIMRKERNEEVRGRIREIMSNKSYSFKSYGGFSNFGFLKFSIKNKEYIVKILDNTKGSKEVYFYNQIFKSKLPILENLTYEWHLSGEKVSLICLKFIDGEKPKNEDTNNILELYHEKLDISKHIELDLKELSNEYSGEFHKHGVIVKKLNEVRDYAITTCSDSNIIEKIEKILNNKKVKELYKLVDCEKHYRFSHNDFHRNNILRHEKNIYLLDWNSYAIRSVGLDIAYYFGKFEHTYSEINKSYIINYLDDDLISKLLYQLNQLIIWKIRLHGNKMDNYLEDFFIPLVDSILKNVELLENRNYEK